MKKVVIGIVASSIVMLGGNVYADAELEDQYAFTIFRRCTTTQAGVLRGVFIYDGEGGGSAEFNYVNNPGGSVNGGWTSCKLANVVVNADGSFTQDLTDCEGEEVFGGAPGTKFTIDPVDPKFPLTQTGQVSVDGKTIIVSVDDPNLETVDFGGNVSQRLCILSGTGVFLRDADADDDDYRDKHWDWDRGKHKDKHRHRDKHKDDD